jgi:hypothetical protein
MYAYAVNNPLTYVDPDGRHAVAIKFSKLAANLGHAGIVSVHADGRGKFADFGPAHSGRPHDKGHYTFLDLNTRLQFDGKGLATKDSLVELANEIADRTGQPRDSVSAAFYATSDAETASLDQYIANAEQLQQAGQAPDYWGGFRDCLAFCVGGLNSAGQASRYRDSSLSAPNLFWWKIWISSDVTASGSSKPKPKTDPEADRRKSPNPCLKTRDGVCVQ